MRAYIFLILLFVCVKATAQIKISKANGVDISANKTFAIQKGEVISLNDKKMNEAQIFSFFKQAMIRVMTTRGYEQAPDSIAHLIISYVYEVSDRTEFQKSGPLGQTPIEDAANVDESYKLERGNEKTTFIIDIEKKASSIWTANCIIDGRQKDLNKTIELTVDAAFKKFPVQGKKK